MTNCKMKIPGGCGDVGCGNGHKRRRRNGFRRVTGTSLMLQLLLAKMVQVDFQISKIAGSCAGF